MYLPLMRTGCPVLYVFIVIIITAFYIYFMTLLFASLMAKIRPKQFILYWLKQKVI